MTDQTEETKAETIEPRTEETKAKTIDPMVARIAELEIEVRGLQVSRNLWGQFGYDVAMVLGMTEAELEPIAEEEAPGVILQRLKQALAAASRGEFGDMQTRRIEAELLAIGWPMDRSAKGWKLEAPAEVATERAVRGSRFVTIEAPSAGVVKLSGLEVLIAPIRARMRSAGFKTQG